MDRRRQQGNRTKDRQSEVLTALGSRIPLVALIQTLAVAEHLSFRNAANALGVSQSSISSRVKMLEAEIGVLLFERHTRGVRLTAAGRRFVERIAVGVDQLDHAVTAAGMAAQGEGGRIRIGVHGLIAHSFLSELVREYRRKYPSVAIEFVESTTRDALRQLRADELDIAFVVGDPAPPDCHSRRIWTEPLVAALPEAHPLAVNVHVLWDDLANETFLVRQDGTGPQVYNHIILRLSARWPPPTIQRIAVERCTLLSMVDQGFGITLVGGASGKAAVPGVAFRPIADEPEPVVFTAVWLPHNREAPLRNLLALADEKNEG